jgi:two-component system chemotaxis response regulator CheB
MVGERNANARPSRDFDVVVIAASAGGIPALETILSGLPLPFPVPILIVSHRAPDGGLGLSRVLGRHTSLLVKDADEGERMHTEVVYLAPPDRHLLVTPEGTLTLSDAPKVKACRPAADVLFRSAAEHYGPRVLGMVLTGADGDGAEGVRRIKEGQGMVIAQDLESSAFNSMPWSAMATGSVDFILPLQEISGTLIRLLGLPQPS